MESVVTYFTQSPRELLVVFGAVFTITYLIYRRQNDDATGKKLPPSVPTLPIVGSLPFLSTKMEDLADYCISPRNKYGKIFSFRFGPR